MKVCDSAKIQRFFSHRFCQHTNLFMCLSFRYKGYLMTNITIRNSLKGVKSCWLNTCRICGEILIRLVSHCLVAMTAQLTFLTAMLTSIFSGWLTVHLWMNECMTVGLTVSGWLVTEYLSLGDWQFKWVFVSAQLTDFLLVTDCLIDGLYLSNSFWLTLYLFLPTLWMTVHL